MFAFPHHLTRVALAALGFTLVAGCGQVAQVAQTATQPSAPPQLTAAESAPVVKPIVVGLDESFPPIAFRDGNGQLIGHDVDFAKEALKRAGVNGEYRAVAWGSKDEMLLKKRSVDMLWSGVNITDARKEVYQFSTPYLDNRQIVVVRADSPIKAFNELGGKTVGVQTGTSLMPKLKAYQGAAGPIAQIADYPEYATILVSMLEGKVDAAVMGDVALTYYMKNSPGKFRVIDGDFGRTDMGVAMRKDDAELHAKINQAIASMKADGTAKAIHDRWFDGRS